MEHVQELLDAVLADVNDGDAAALRSRLRPAALVRIVDGATGVTVDEGRDADAHERFGLAIADAAVGRGRQERGDIHPGEPLAAMVAVYDADGRKEVHTFVVGIDGDRLDRLVWYRP